jgi:NAD(P)-dependent dehydrogenase (short-subunit alcohol dehydrogenase family)
LITGGGSGIGAAIASAMISCGAQVILIGRREAQLKEQVTALGNLAHYVVHDILELERANELIEGAESRFGPITCLVNNAGIHIKKPAVETSVDEFRQVMDTHILGAHALTCALAPRMMERGRGSILFTASMASLFGIPMVVAYSAAKSAMLGVVRTLATEFSPHGVRVNAIAPGWIETAMSRKAMDGDPRKEKQDPQPHAHGAFWNSRRHWMGRSLSYVRCGSFRHGSHAPRGWRHQYRVLRGFHPLLAFSRRPAMVNSQ